jgi:hypothetical protein
MYFRIKKKYDRKTVGHIFTNFFFGVKDRVFVPPLPHDLTHLKVWIIAAVNVDALVLTRVLQELDYRMDACRVTRGAHIEHL